MSPNAEGKFHPLEDSRAPSPGTTLIIAVSLSNFPGLGNLRSPRKSPGEQGGKSMLVRDVMRKTVSVHAEETLQLAALRLKQENVGALPVVEADQVAGMVTDRDILLRGPAGGRSIDRQQL